MNTIAVDATVRVGEGGVANQTGISSASARVVALHLSSDSEPRGAVRNPAKHCREDSPKTF
jgi:hypothetical protein